MAKLALILISIAAIISEINGGSSLSLQDKRIRSIQSKMTKMNKWLTGVRKGNYGCNDTIYSMSKTVSRIAGLVDHLYAGPILAKMDLSRRSTTYDKVLIKVPNAMEACLKTYEGTQMPRANAQIYCLQTILWRYEAPISARRIRRARNTVRRFSTSIGIPPTPVRLRIRREYRALSEIERNRFHEAMNELYEVRQTERWDGTIADFRLIHKLANSGAHGGPAFLPWHRTFINSLENALFEKKPGVTLPYWASYIDDQMDNPTNSKIWTKDFLGNGMGAVTTGPFEGWISYNGESLDEQLNSGPLERAYGENLNSRLISKEKIDDIMSLCDFVDFSLPNAVQSIELPHNGVHRWVGGDMTAPGLAPWDPVFYLHHCFIDYLWEKVRERQKNVCGVDPETDYDYGTNKADQQFDDQMLGQDYLISEGLSNYWTESVYRYWPAPTCENNCSNSEHLYCARWLDCCVHRPRFQGPTDVRAFPPGSGASGSHSTVFVATSRCNPYLDPGCIRQQIIRNDKAGIPLQPDLELAAMKAMVPRNRGPLFEVDPTDVDTRSLRTLKADIEEGIKKREKWIRANLLPQ